MKKIRDMERRGGRKREYCTLYLKTRKHPKYENEIWTTEENTEKREK